MIDTELKEVVDDICMSANENFSCQKRHTDQKWMLRNGETVLESIDLIDVMVNLTVCSLRNNAAYIQLTKYIESLSSVQTIIPIAGRHTQPWLLVMKLIQDAFLPSEQRFEPEQLLKKLEVFKTFISSEFHDFTLTGRLHGLRCETGLVELEPNIFLVRLDEDAINERQPFLSEVCPDLPRVFDFSDSNVEIRIIKSFQITPHYQLSYFNVSDQARSELEQVLDAVVRSIKLYRPGTYEVYPRTYTNTLTGSFSLSPIQPKYISGFNNAILNDTDVNDLKYTFLIVKNVISQDRVLSRSFSRFLIGLDECVPEERIVDFVIAWESLLLTVNGSSINSEVSYRFSLNGAAILVAADKTLEFTKALELMKGVYGIRSTIVHGGNTDSLCKNIGKLGFDNISDLNCKLSELYRKVVYWLVGFKKEERPYEVSFGWELLIRKIP